MSCDNRRKHFLAAVSGEPAVTNALGGDAATAQTVLEGIYRRSGLEGVAPSDKMRREAERDCTALFLEFKKNGLDVPAHTQPKPGQVVALPDTETTMKYAAIYRTLKAARKKTELPGLAASLVRHQLALKATANDEKGHLRCKNCGQFASQYREHTCPRTTTAARMEQHVRARLGIPTGCYATPDGGNLLQMLITESNTPGSRGMVKLVHPLSGEQQEATLDGALLAIRSGYLPQSWQTAASFGGFSLKQVVTPKGQTAYVADAKNLALATLSKAQSVSVSTNSITQAAAAYGLSPATASQYQHQPAPTAMPAIATATANSPQALSFSGGTSYDLGRFSGTEFRKDNGQSIAGTPFYVGQEFTGNTYFASARSSGGPGGQPLYPAPPGSKIRAGRTLVAAANLLADPDARVEVSPAGAVEVYSAKENGLVASYHPATGQAGDIYGTSNASSYQLAAIVGAMAANPQTPVEQALATDLAHLKANPTDQNLIKASDAAYIAVREQLENTDFELGNTLGGVGRCAGCGQYTGATAHLCPTPATVSAPPTTTTATAIPAPVPPLVTPTANNPQPPASASNSGADLTQTPTTPLAEGPGQVPVVQVNVQSAVAVPDIKVEAVAATPAVNVTVQAPEVAANAAPLTAQFDAASSEQFAQALGAKLAEGLRPLVDSQAARNIGAAVGVSTNASSTDPLTQDALAGISAALTTLATRLPGATEEKLANALDRLATRLATLSLPLSGTPAPVPAANNNATPAPASVPPSANRERERVAAKPAPVRPEFAGRHANPVEHILARVEPLSPPDPYLMSVPPELGGHRLEPLPQYYQELDPHYEVSADSQKALELVTASLQKAWDSDPTKRPPGTQYRSFAFAGTAGTGKNTTARQIAAALKLPYYEMTVNKDTSFQEEIGQTVLTTDPTSGATVSRAQLGKLGQVAASGGIICVNEIIKANPGMQGALQTMLEDGFVEIAGTEAGMAGGRIPVHPSTVFIATFNPGYDGSAARPDGALLSRMQTVIMNAPSISDQARRLGSEMERLFGVGKLPVSEVDRKERERLTNLMQKDYKIRQPAAISKNRLEAAANFFGEVRQLAQTRQIAATSTHVAEPSPREVARFLAISEATGDPKLALEQLKVYCDPGEMHEEQWNLVQVAFEQWYGRDGQSLNRAEAGQGPKQN